MDQIYQALIDRTRTGLDVKSLPRFLGASIDRIYPRKKSSRPPIQRKARETCVRLTVFKLHFGKLSLKIYDKGERNLRIEGVAHNIKDLKCGKDITRLCDMIST